MEQTINERFVKLSSRLPISFDIALGSDIRVMLADKNYLANCVKIETKDNQDGTVDLIYNLKFLAE